MSKGDDNVRQFTVAPDDDGIRVDRWFKRHLDTTSFTIVAKWARTGQLRVDGARVGTGCRPGRCCACRPPSRCAPTRSRSANARR